MITKLIQHLKQMSKPILVHYAIIVVLALLSAFFIIKPYIKEEVKPEPTSLVYRGAVPDSIYETQYKLNESKPVEESKSINYEAIIAAVSALGVSWLSLKSSQHNNKLEKYQQENTAQHEEIKKVLETVIEQSDKQEVIDKLDETTNTALHLTDDRNCQILIDSVAVKTKQFVLDIMTDELTPDLYDYALVKIDAKAHEALTQVRGMGMSEDYYQEFNRIQSIHIEKLKKDLHSIMTLNIVNHKYARFGNAIKQFLVVFIRDIIKLSNK